MNHPVNPVWDKIGKRINWKLKCKTCGERVVGMGTVIQPWRHDEPPRPDPTPGPTRTRTKYLISRILLKTLLVEFVMYLKREESIQPDGSIDDEELMLEYAEEFIDGNMSDLQEST